MRIFSIFVILLTLLTGLSLTQPPAHAQTDLGSCVELINAIRADVDSTAPLPERYQDLRLIDIHNHDSANVDRVMSEWDALYVDQTVIFGAISEPRAIRSDQRGLRAYSHYPDRVFPFFAGVDTYGEDGVEQVRANLEQGYYGIGEIVGASSYSPMTSNLAWKAEHPHDGNLPAIYDLAADYGVPVLLHIDPPDGYPIQKLEEALDAHPDTILIFAHANAYNSPSNIDRLLGAHPNLSIDFFAGFTVYNQDSTNTLADFIPVIEQYPDRFFVGTDSGYGVGYENAVLATYQLIDQLTPETACRVAHQNILDIFNAQPATESQLAQIEELSGEASPSNLNKQAAHELLFALMAQ